MIEKLPSDPLRDMRTMAPAAVSTRSHPRRFAPHFLRSAVVVAVLGLFAQEASALALGRVTVQSALGEVLNAEIDIPDINPDEIASLSTNMGSAEAFRRLGLEYTSAVAGLRVGLQRRADGRAYLRLSSDRVITEPFLDLVIEANWSAGHMLRDYTLLFDPPVTRQTTAATLAPQISPVAPSRVARAVPIEPAQSSSAVPVLKAAPAQARPPAPVKADVRPAAPKASEKQAVVKSEPDSKRITVRPGDTASKIAATLKPPSISLDQMLLALLQANPSAFTGANINRLKSGVVLNVPDAQTAGSLPANEAAQTVLAQSRDFNDFRRKLASGTAVATVDAPARTSGGKIQVNIEDKKTSNTLPDKLSLHKGEIIGKTKQENLAKEMQAKAAEKRLAELNKNISDLKKLSAITVPSKANTTSTAALPEKTASAPGLTVPMPSPVAATPAAVAAPTAPASAPAPAVVPAAVTTTVATPAPVASAPVAEKTSPAATVTVAPTSPASAAVAAATLPPASPTESGFLADLLDNPLVAPAAGGLVALLVGLGLYRVRQRKKMGQVDSAFSESRLQPDSFFGASGGERIDTGESVMAGSSMMYSPSQLDAGADVDPVAEADVYLAYGRDLQAEEILKEALRVNPSRAAIHFKLLQIYAKRRDILSYAATAEEAHKLTNGLGSEWAQACEAGRELDPPNALYHGEGISGFFGLGAASTKPVALPDSTFPSTDLFANSADPLNPINPSDDVDLDLDFSDAPPSLTARANATALPKMAAAAMSSLPDLDFELDAPPPPIQYTPPSAAHPVMGVPDGIDYTLDDIPATQPSPPKPTPAVQPDAMAFDMDVLSFDLDMPASAANQPALSGFGDAEESVFNDLHDEDDGGDPLATKLALAEEFQAIGDEDGARTLAQEVADAATGSLKAKAEQFLAGLG
jgi:pilus assembly protein FimV